KRTVFASDGVTGTTGWTGLTPGAYTLSEFTPGDKWNTSPFDCVYSGAITGATTGPAQSTNLNLPPGTTASCVISNTLNGNLILAKQTIPAGSQQAFGLGILLNGITQTVWALRDGDSVDTGPLPPAVYTGSEILPPGWRQLSFTCDDPANSNFATTGVFVPPGVTYTCTAVHEQLGQITVAKFANATVIPFRNTGFPFTGDLGNFTLNTVNGYDKRDFPNLVAGNYTITENTPPGWIFLGAECTDNATGAVVGDPTTGVTLAPGQEITCRFRNQKELPAIELFKQVTTPPDTRCEASRNSITVLPNAPLIYCFKVTNTGNVTLTGPIELRDPALGLVLNVLPVPLAPGASRLVTATATSSTTIGIYPNLAGVEDLPTGVVDDDDAEVVVASAEFNVRKEVGFSPGGPWYDANVDAPLPVDVGDLMQWRLFFENGSTTETLVLDWPPLDELNGVPVA
ncbi:MAG: prealbumin-like fold domain-containing protein, partial [Caldilineaceae bacterium]